MLSTKTLTVALVALLATGGAAATVGTVSTAQTAGNAHVQDADVDATMTNETVTVSVHDDGAPVTNATVHANDAIATTDGNGTVTFEHAALADENESLDELDVTVEKGAFAAELEYRVENGSLTLLEESYEYDRDASGDDAEEDDGDESDDRRFDQAPPEHAMDEDAPPEHAMNDDAPLEHAMDDETEDGDEEADDPDDETDEDDSDDDADDPDDDAAGDD